MQSELSKGSYYPNICENLPKKTKLLVTLVTDSTKNLS